MNATISSSNEYIETPGIRLAESGIVPDFLIRLNIKKLCAVRHAEYENLSLEARTLYIEKYVQSLKQSPIAIQTKEANEQHYELPTDFFKLCLGKHLKYSSGYYEYSQSTLDDAELAALEKTCENAELKDGQSILELGCGWGSLTLFMAERFKQSKIIALSNSSTQKIWIDEECKRRGLKNVTVLTRNANSLNDLPARYFDRVVSVEMFEHLKNYERLFEVIANTLKEDGKALVHVFTHENYPYAFETAGENNWLGNYFFTGGQMPSAHLFYYFQSHLTIVKRWGWSGTHYSRTAEDWLKNLDKNKQSALKILNKHYGELEGPRWLQRWRMFYLSCAELFGYQNGTIWGVNHYLFEKRKA